MAGVNKVIIIGNLGQDPEVRYPAAGDCVCNLSVATSESWKDQSGQKQERTEWHRIVLFKRLAEVAGQYLTKGSKVYIEGSLRTRKWQDSQGNDRYTTEVVVGMGGKMEMLSAQQGQQQQPQQQPQQQRQQAPAQPGGYDDFDDSIPF